MLTVILTGGASRRMGRDKALIPFGSGSMSESLVRRYSVLGSVALSVNEAGRFPTYGAIELPDAFPGLGPINGIYSAFSAIDEEELLLTATDLPFGEPRLALRLAELRGGHQVCAIERNGRMEPLFAVYGRSCLDVAEKALIEGRLSVNRLLRELDTLVITREQLPEFDIDRLLMNVNTPEDYAVAIGRIRQNVTKI